MFLLFVSSLAFAFWVEFVQFDYDFDFYWLQAEAYNEREAQQN